MDAHSVHCGMLHAVCWFIAGGIGKGSLVAGGHVDYYCSVVGGKWPEPVLLTSVWRKANPGESLKGTLRREI